MNKNPWDLAGAGANYPLLVGVVSIFPHWKVKEVRLELCRRFAWERQPVLPMIQCWRG